MSVTVEIQGVLIICKTLCNCKLQIKISSYKVVRKKKQKNMLLVSTKLQ